MALRLVVEWIKCGHWTAWLVPVAKAGAGHGPPKSAHTVAQPCSGHPGEGGGVTGRLTAPRHLVAVSLPEDSTNTCSAGTGLPVWIIGGLVEGRAVEAGWTSTEYCSPMN